MTDQTIHSTAPANPWPGQEYDIRHRWDLDGLTDLSAASQRVRDLAAEFRAADAAGWALTQPLDNGYLFAERASRRERAELRTNPAAPADQSSPADGPVGSGITATLFVVDQPAEDDDATLDAIAADQAGVPIITLTPGADPVWSGQASDELKAVVLERLPDGAAGTFAVALGFDGQAEALVTVGSALDEYALENGTLQRADDFIAFHHVMDGSGSLPVAAARLDAFAGELDALVTYGVQIVDSDGGHLRLTRRPLETSA